MNGLLALAFAAGMLAPVNPCGFALLPAYLAHTLTDQGAASLPARLRWALGSGIALAAGFAATLMAAGLAVSAGARPLISAAPGLGLLLGAALLLLGAFMLIGRSLSVPLPALARRPAAPAPAGLARWVGFGAAYAAASLACTFGVLLAVIAQAQATAGLTGLLTIFAAYGAGSAAVLLLVSLATAVAGAALTRRIGALARHHTRITGAVMVGTGAYLAWYWLPVATGRTATSGGALAGLAATAATWLGAHTTAVAALTAVAVAAAAVTVIARRNRTPHHGPTPPGPSEQDCCTTDTTDPHDANRAR